MNTIYKKLTIKSVSDSGEISGTITDATPDRMGDIVEPSGVDTTNFEKNGILLYQHDSDRPIGTLTNLKKSAAGLWASFRFASSQAAQEVRKLAVEQVIRSFSIGFSPIEYEPIKSGGLRFLKSELLEVSLVSVPANPAALVTQTKSYQSALEGRHMTTPQGTTRKINAPAVHTGPQRKYGISNYVRRALDPSWDAGLEIEVAQEIRRLQPWRDFKGMPVLDPAVVEKANSAIPGGNMADLTGVDYMDQLFAATGTGIPRQDLMSLLNVTRVQSNEMTIQVPTLLTPMTSGHVALDSDLPTSNDSTFATAQATAKLYGGNSRVNISAIMFANHPGAGSPDVVGMEMNKSMVTERNRVFLNGDETSNPEEFDGLLIQYRFGRIARTDPDHVGRYRKRNL